MKLRIIQIMLLCLAGLPSLAPATNVADRDTVSIRSESAWIRGYESPPRIRGGRLRHGVNALLWLPRFVLDKGLQVTARGAYIADDVELLDRVNRLLSFGSHRFGWHPVVNVSSGSKSSFGAYLHYDADLWHVSGGARYRNPDIWTAKTKVGRDFQAIGQLWETELSGRLRRRDDYRFYGFGSDPANDPRNGFLGDGPGAYSVFAQRISRLDLAIGTRLNRHWTLRWNFLLRKREVRQIDAPIDALDYVGLTGVGVGKQIYDEIALIRDTRPHRDRITPGSRLEVHFGLSEGFDGDPVRFSRAGVDAALYIPVIGQDRVIVPRLVLDTINSRNDDAPIPFADYPRQRIYRGISSAHLLRVDSISLMPSLEYQWPLTYRLNAHVFWESLLVAGTFADLSFDTAPWAVGIGLDLQTRTSELARVSVAGGSEGLRVLFSLGFSNRVNARTKWQ